MLSWLMIIGWLVCLGIKFNAKNSDGKQKVQHFNKTEQLTNTAIDMNVCVYVFIIFDYRWSMSV